MLSIDWHGQHTPLPVGNTLLSEVILVIMIAIVLFIIFKLGKSILKIIFGIIANSILGIIAIFALELLLEHRHTD